MNSFIQSIITGTNIALLGIALAVILPGIGSSKSVGMVGEAGAGLITEDPSSFSKVLILQVIPGTQGLYGFVVGLFALISLGVFGGTMPDLTIQQGVSYFLACMPIAVVGLISAMYQGRVAVSGVNILAKRPNEMFKGVMLAVMVEFYAILALLVSFLIVLSL
ncbi:MAG: V-type ATP synthase subunit K [Eubacteriales bacterium]|jgi:V/A-type H+-transporting ATPase subunit K